MKTQPRQEQEQLLKQQLQQQKIFLCFIKQKVTLRLFKHPIQLFFTNYLIAFFY